MAKKGAVGGTKEAPLEMRESLARYLNDAIKERGWTTRQAAQATGIDISTLSKVRNAKTASGVMFLVRLRTFLQVPTH